MADAFTTAVGTPTLGEYIAQLYSQELIRYLYPNTVFGQIANTDYQSMVKKYGDKVIMRLYPEGVFNDYVPGMDIDYDEPDPDTIEMEIDHGKYWAMFNDLVQMFQSDIDYPSKWAAHFGRKLQIEVDKDLLYNVYADVHASNTGLTAGAISGSVNLGVSGTPLAVTTSSIAELITNMALVLDEQNVPDEDRWLVVPSWFIQKMKNSDLKAVWVTGDDKSPLRSGKAGDVDRFKIMRSNNLYYGASGGHTAFEIIFGHPLALTFATQLAATEQVTFQNKFGKAIRSLIVYGYKVVKSEAIGHAHVYAA